MGKEKGGGGGGGGGKIFIELLLNRLKRTCLNELCMNRENRI